MAVLHDFGSGIALGLNFRLLPLELLLALLLSALPLFLVLRSLPLEFGLALGCFLLRLDLRRGCHRRDGMGCCFGCCLCVMHRAMVANHFANGNENAQHSDDEIVLSALDGTADEKLTGLALRLVLSDHIGIPRENWPESRINFIYTGPEFVRGRFVPRHAAQIAPGEDPFGFSGPSSRSDTGPPLAGCAVEDFPF